MRLQPARKRFQIASQGETLARQEEMSASQDESLASQEETPVSLGGFSASLEETQSASMRVQPAMLNFRLHAIEYCWWEETPACQEEFPAC